MNKFIKINAANNSYLVNPEEIQVIDCIDKDLKLVILFKAGCATKLNLVYYTTDEYNSVKIYLFSRL